MRPRTGIAAAIAVLGAAGAIAAVTVPAGASTAHPAFHSSVVVPGDLLVSTSYYENDPGLVAGSTILPLGETVASGNGALAVASGNYPYVFNNDTVDGSFGVTSPLVLKELTTDGRPVASIPVPTQYLDTSFSSKSEGALNLSTDGKYVTFIDYSAAPDTIDASNGNTPGDVDPTNPVPQSYYRTVASLNQQGQFTFTETNDYSGNNGRAAIAANVGGQEIYYTVGNAGNGSNPEPEGVVTGAGIQMVTPSTENPYDQTSVGQPEPIGSFNITELPNTAADKSAKDNNYRGLTIENNVLYFTKGSGSNGVDTVYYLNNSGTPCTGGVGIPAADQTLPTTDIASSYFSDASAKKPDPDLTTDNICILKGFPTALAANATDTSDYPFGIWFASPTVLYVADEGADDTTSYDAATHTYTSEAAGTSVAGLEKWVYDAAEGQWNLAYTIQNGLNLGVTYNVPGYPTGTNPYSVPANLPWAPATDGLRNITGKVNPNGTVTIWAVTSTVSGGGDQGADPNALVSVTDNLGATTLPSSESFRTVVAPAYGQVVRGVSFTPGTHVGS
jgi:hypothetical protein